MLTLHWSVLAALLFIAVIAAFVLFYKYATWKTIPLLNKEREHLVDLSKQLEARKKEYPDLTYKMEIMRMRIESLESTNKYLTDELNLLRSSDFIKKLQYHIKQLEAWVGYPHSLSRVEREPINEE